MKNGSVMKVAAASAIVLAVWTGREARVQSQQTQPATAPTTKELSTQDINDAFVRRVSSEIAGREQEAASQVFKNIQLDVLKKAPASRLLLIMNLGYSRALGVTCEHCHLTDDFSKDDKRPKRAAREMALMHFSINQQLAKMQELEPNPQGHFVNCWTCHRGSSKPKEQ